MNSAVSITRDDITPRLAQIYDSVAPGRRRPLMAILGRTAEGIYRRWFRFRNQDSPNTRGWSRQNFWNRIARATAYDPARTTADQAMVTVGDPALAAKVHGATIRPTGGRKALAIPMREEAYGVQPRSGIIPGLFVTRTKDGRAFLAAKDSSDPRFLKYFYRLVGSVTVKPDARALPPKSSVAAELTARAEKWILRPPTSAKS